LIKKATIYHIFFDRFSGFDIQKDWKKPIFIGGTIKGIIKKIPYLQQLGIDTIWISPFYQTSAYHGYHITDFFETDARFGTKDDVKYLIKQVHQAKMRIIVDFVPNHCSHLHPFFIDGQQNRNSRYRNWFYFKKWPDNYLCFLSFKELPKLNLENKETRDHIIDAARYWLSFGFDGFRLDHVIGPSHRFWSYFVENIKSVYPQIILIGEAWMQGIRFHELSTIRMNGKYMKWILGNSSDYLLRSYQGLLDGVLDFHGQQLIKKYSFYQSYTIMSLQFHLIYKSFKQILPIFLDR
jgi:glycosidase